MGVKPIPYGPWKGIDASTGTLTQPKGTIPRGSNLILAKRGSLRTVDGSTVIDAYNGILGPDTGPVAGGTAVTISGTNFITGATVSFGGTAATSVVVVSSTEITCVTPAHAAGSVTVSVTTTGGTASVPNGFTFV
jgi:large repetitive protein